MISRTRLLLSAALMLLALGLQPARVSAQQTECDPFGIPYHLSPAEYTVFSTTSVTFEWDTVVDAAGYAVYFWDESDPKVEQSDGEPTYTTNDTAYTVNNLKADHWYRWTVRGIHPDPACGRGDATSTSIFGIKSAAKAIIPPRLYRMSPSKGTEMGFVRLDWLASPVDTQYQIYRTDPTTHQTTQITTTTDTFYEDHGVAGGKHYQYSGKACNASGCGLLSSLEEGWSSAGCPILTAPQNLKPVNNATVYESVDAGAWTEFSWDEVPTVTDYQLQIYNLRDKSLVEDSTFPGYGLSRLLDQGDYKWRVRAIAPVNGCAAGAWTSLQTMHVRWWPVPNPPRNMRASDHQYPDRIILNWDPPATNLIGETAGYYMVYRRDCPNGEGQVIDEMAHVVPYVDWFVEPGKHYQYRAAACTEFGGCSPVGPIDEGSTISFDHIFFFPIMGR